MDRRDFLNLAGQGSVVTWLASFWGKNRANVALSNSAPKQTGTSQELDIDHRGRREAYESRQVASTITASTLGLAVTYPAMGNNVLKSNGLQEIDDKLERVPREHRPDNFLDLTRTNGQHDRRQFINQAGAAAVLGGLVGPVITYFSDPGGKAANLIHGDVKENEDPVITRHRYITVVRQNLLSTSENSAAIGSLFLLQRVTGEDNALLSAKCQVVGKDRINNLFADGKDEITFKCDRVESGENLLALLPDSFQDENIRLQIQVQNESNTIGYVIDYDNKRGFYERDIGGNPKETCVRLRGEDVVTIKRSMIRAAN